MIVPRCRDSCLTTPLSLPAPDHTNTCCVNALRLLHRRVHVRSLSSAAAPARARADDPPHRGQYHRGTTASPGLLVSLRTQTNATIQYLTTPMYRRHDGASRHRPHRVGRFRCRFWRLDGGLDAPSASHWYTVSAAGTGASHDATLQMLEHDVL